MSLPRLPNLALTSTSKGVARHNIESQLQKIYSIYALSRFLDVSYFHSPLQLHSDFSYTKNDESISATVNHYEKFFHIPSDRELPDVGTTHRLPSADLGTLCNLRDKAKREIDSFHLVEIISARQIVEKHPHILHYIKEVSPFKNLSSPSSPLRIAIHTRYGDLLEPEKALPNSFYITTVQQLLKKLYQLNLPFVCELYMEIASSISTVSLSTLSLNKNIFKLANPEKSFTKEFEVLPNLKKFINHDSLASLQSLATADFLFISCYSLSYLAALLNKKGLIIYHPFLEHPLPGWINATHPEVMHSLPVD